MAGWQVGRGAMRVPCSEGPGPVGVPRAADPDREGAVLGRLGKPEVVLADARMRLRTSGQLKVWVC